MQAMRLNTAGRDKGLKIAIGYEFIYQVPQPTPMIVSLNVHSSRAGDIIVADMMTTSPVVPITFHLDNFGNQCARLVAPAGHFRLASAGTVIDADTPDRVVPDAVQHAVEDLPVATLPFLLGSRYCETDVLAPIAWKLFGETKPGWARVQAVCDFVHKRIKFDYMQARNTRTALQGYQEQVGVCRDYAHLGVALCRALNIPARYCTGYLSDIGEPLPHPPGDFAGWFEAYLGGAWHTFDPRNNKPRLGRILMAYGRDAADVALCNIFGPSVLESFTVWTHEAI
jgi:transglutaminase-like putative cysteine protease